MKVSLTFFRESLSVNYALSTYSHLTFVHTHYSVLDIINFKHISRIYLCDLNSARMFENSNESNVVT